mgnify:CR=1 FL=1
MQFSSNAVDELLFGVSSVIQSAVIAAAVHYMNRRESVRRQRSIWITFPRQRSSVVEVYNSMGPRIFRRAFRMTFDAFWRLHSILLPHLRTAISDNSNYVRKGGREGGNSDSGYVTLRTDDRQQNTAVPAELLHGGEHFEDVPDYQLRAQRRRNLGVELPQTRLFQLIVDGHWQRPIMRRGNTST